jgi:uncharacterized protein (UPF0335 family)
MLNADLNAICTKIARLEQERKELAADISRIKKEAKDEGYDVALIGKVVSIMLKSASKQREAIEQIDLFPTYLNAVGLLTEAAIEAGRPSTPPASPGDAVGPAAASPTFDVKTPPEAADLPPHDPTTGEIHDPPALPGGDDEDASAPRSAAGQLSKPPAELAGSIHMPPIPEALDRRARVA